MNDRFEPSDLEARLRAAYQARATAVRPESLRLESDPSRPTAPVTRATARRARWLFPLLAAAAVAALALGTLSATTLTDHVAPLTDGTALPYPTNTAPTVSQPSTAPATLVPTSRTGSSAVPAPTMLGHGQVGTRADIPWTLVGSGWTLAVLSANGRSRSDAGALYLVDPQGGRYAVGAKPTNWYLEAWSPDGQRALISDEGRDGPTHYTEITLATGAERHFTLPGTFLTYTKPRGLAIVIDTGRGMARYGTDGTLQLTFPQSLPQLGSVNSAPPLYTDDGSQLVVSTQRGLALLDNDGHLVRALRPPKGWSDCGPARWWSDAIVLAVCDRITTNSDFELFEMPLSGAAPTQLTHGADDIAPLGYSDAWLYADGLFALATPGCGPPRPVLLNAQGRGVPLSVPLPSGVAGNLVYVGHHDNVVVFRVNPSACQGARQSLIAYNLVSHSVTTLLGPGVGPGSASDAAPFDGDR